MKKNLNYCFRALLMAGLLVTPPLAFSACADDEIQRPEVTEPLLPDPGPEGDEGTIKLEDAIHTVAFNSGSDGVNSFRIPAIVTAKDGSLVVFAEARYKTWMDKSHTDVVAKRSTDGGKTWSAISYLTRSANGGSFAFMDPCPVVDRNTGRMWMFCCRWKAGNDDARNNRAFVVISDDNGVTWGAPQDVTDQIILPGYYPSGFGPGSGFQIADGRYTNRLIVPTRQYNGSSSGCVTVYSDNRGETWSIGSPITPGGECQMADCGDNMLTLNIRMGGGRRVATSKDGGVTWSAPTPDAALPGIAGGCQASVLGVAKSTVFFCGIQGGTATSSYDDRARLAIYRSLTGAITWTRNKLLYEKAAGYACMSQLPDGSVAIVFECGDGAGFTKASSRPAGWMRLDVLVLPKEVTQRGYWFE